MKKIILIPLFFILGASANSYTQSSSTAPDHCAELTATYGVLDVARLWSESAQKCWVTLSPNNYQNLKYRQFIFSSEGMMMVFNSFGQGANSQYTGAREYYFFPRTKPEVLLNVVESKKSLSITLPNKKSVHFKFDKAEFDSLDSARTKVASEIDVNNRGGFEILSYDGVYMDCGFQLGQSPVSSPYRFCHFFDAKRQICRVQNQQIFTYLENNDVVLQSDREVKQFVQRTCPEFEWK
jgi:hypothetical protein